MATRAITLLGTLLPTSPQCPLLEEGGGSRSSASPHPSSDPAVPMRVLDLLCLPVHHQIQRCPCGPEAAHGARMDARAGVDVGGVCSRCGELKREAREKLAKKIPEIELCPRAADADI